jgi:hypothetical protein
MTRWCNNWNVLHLRFAHFQRVIDSANSQNVLAGMNFIKVILPIGSCHCLANTPQCLIRLHLEKRDSDANEGGPARPTTPPVRSVACNIGADTTSDANNAAKSAGVAIQCFTRRIVPLLFCTRQWKNDTTEVQ